MASASKLKKKSAVGKRVRRNHVIYEIEKRLSLNHEDIAHLLQPTFPSLTLIEDICKSPRLSPLLTQFVFSFSAKDVTKLISGRARALAKLAENRLCYRLGISYES